MAEIFSKTVLRGGIQREGRGNLANTWLKMALILFPAFLGSWQLLRNWQDKPFSLQQTTALLTALLGTLVVQAVDLRDDAKGRMKKWGIFALGVEAILLLIYFDVVDVSRLADLLIVYQPLKWISGLGDFSDLIVFACFIVAGKGALLLTATDAFIVGGLFSWWGRLSVIYEIIITTYFAVYHSLARSLRNSWLVGKNRYRLLAGRRSRWIAIRGFVALFGKSLLTALTERSELAESVLTERRWYTRMLRNPVTGGWNPEDTVAVVMLGLFLMLSLYLWIG